MSCYILFYLFIFLSFFHSEDISWHSMSGNTVKVQVENKLYKHPVEHIIPLELSCKETRDAIQPEGLQDKESNNLQVSA